MDGGRWRRLARAARRAGEVATVLLACGLLGLWCSVPPNLDGLRAGEPVTTAFIDLRRATAQAHGRTLNVERSWRGFDDISVHLRRAVMMAEDFGFVRHHGVEWGTVLRATWRNLTLRDEIGGSTITQQLAKNLFLSPERSLGRKAREVLIAGRLEAALSKRRILELYLNVIEWGDGVFGAEAAARHWYGVSAAALTPAQAVRLAVTLPSPRARDPRALDAALTAHAATLLRRLARNAMITPAELTAALADLYQP